MASSTNVGDIAVCGFGQTIPRPNPERKRLSAAYAFAYVAQRSSAACAAEISRRSLAGIDAKPKAMSSSSSVCACVGGGDISRITLARASLGLRPRLSWTRLKPHRPDTTAMMGSWTPFSTPLPPPTTQASP